MAGAVTRICSERLASFFFQPQSTRWVHRGVQTVFRRFCSDSKSYKAPVGSPEIVYPGHPGYNRWKQDAMNNAKWRDNPPKFIGVEEETITMVDLMKEIRKLNERFEKLLPLLRDNISKK